MITLEDRIKIAEWAGHKGMTSATGILDEASHFEALIKVIVDKGITINFYESKAFGFFELKFKRKDGTINVGHGEEAYYNEVVIKVAVLDGDRQKSLLEAVKQLIEKEKE